MAWQTSLKETWQKYHDLIAVTIFGVFIHLFPFLNSGRDPLGYDGGFYRRYVIDHIYFWQNVPGLGSEAVVPKFTFDVLKFFQLPTSVVLYGSYVALYCGITIGLYFLVKHWSNAKTAFFSTLLFTISSVQYFGFWCMLYKNIYAFLLLILTAYLIDKKSNWMYLGVALLAFTHQTTSIIFLLSLAVFFVIQKESRRQTLLMLGLGGSLFFLLQAPNIPAHIATFPVASFLSWKQYLLFGFPILLLALFGMKEFAKRMRGSFYFAFGLVVLLYPFFQLPFFQRILLYTDLALIVVASYGIVHLFEKKFRVWNIEQSQLGKVIAISLLAFTSIFLIHKMVTLFPIVTEKEISQLEQIDSFVPVESYVLTNMSLAPWVEGFSHTHVISPGLLHDNHNQEEWNQFWNEEDLNKKIIFLNSFPKPLYVFLPPRDQILFVPNGCGQPLSEYLIRYTCN